MMQAPAALLVGSVYLMGTVAESAAGGANLEALLVQAGGAGLALVVGFYLLRRYDDRADKAEQRADKLLAEERAAHAATVQLLVEERARRLTAEAHTER